MKKLEYIKPEMDVLDSELGVILCLSDINRGVTSDDPEYDGDDIGEAGSGQKP